MVCSKKGQNHKRAHTFQTYVAHRSPHTTQEGDFRSQTGSKDQKNTTAKNRSRIWVVCDDLIIAVQAGNNSLMAE